MRFSIAALALVLSAPAPAESARADNGSCAAYIEKTRPLVRPAVEAIRLLEREAADRLRGLDTRTFPYLAAEARKAANSIADTSALDAEQVLESCRDQGPPLRSVCRDAAMALASALDAQERNAATKEGRQAYAQAMPVCERLLALQSLNTAWRATGD